MRAAQSLTQPRVTPLRVVPVVAIAALAVIALDRLAVSPPPARAPATQPVETGPARGYDSAFARYDGAVADARARAEGRGAEWLIQEQVARALLARGRLSGSYDDYAAAQAALNRAFRNAPPGAGPHLAQASLHLLMHRLAEAERMLDAIGRYAVPPDRGEQAELAGMRGDIAFYRGDYAAAWHLYGEADRLQPGAAAFRRAVFQSKMGRSDLAEQQYDIYERSLARTTPQLRANIELQRGILDLDSGRWSEALAHFRRADAVFPGWWLVEEHIAETTALLGDTAAAERFYRRVVERTAAPEFMDALALLLAARGAESEAAGLRRHSRTLWDIRLRQFPEAAYGHALDHCRAFGDRACALRLAHANYEARPYGEAAEQLALALADSGRLAEARRLVDRVLATSWRTAPLFATAHRIYAAQGETQRAEALRREALQLNARIFD